MVILNFLLILLQFRLASVSNCILVSVTPYHEQQHFVLFYYIKDSVQSQFCASVLPMTMKVFETQRLHLSNFSFRYSVIISSFTNIEVQNVNKTFVYITSTLTILFLSSRHTSTHNKISTKNEESISKKKSIHHNSLIRRNELFNR